MPEKLIWFYYKQDERRGPFSEADFKVMAASGQIQPTDLVWKAGFTDWVTAASVPDLIRSSETPPPPLPPIPPPPRPIGPQGLKTPSGSVLSDELKTKYLQELSMKGGSSTLLISVGGVLMVLYGLSGIINIDSKLTTIFWIIGSLSITGVWHWFQYQRYLKYTDEQLSSAYQEHLAETRTKRIINAIVVATIAIIGFYVFTNDKARTVAEKIFSKANCETVSQEAYRESFANGSGYIVRGTIRNKGKSDDVFVTAHLFSSEGDYEKNQKISLLAGASTTVSYPFTELTRNATNITYRLDCAPQRN